MNKIIKKATYVAAWLPLFAWVLGFTELAIHVNGLFALGLVFTGVWAIPPEFVRQRLVSEGAMKELPELGDKARLRLLVFSLVLVLFLIAGVIALAFMEKDWRILGFMGILGMGLYGVLAEISREIRENRH